jgi:hypothetical protein
MLVFVEFNVNRILSDWTSLEILPEKAVRILGGDVGSIDERKTVVFVETISGAVYSCCKQETEDWVELSGADEIEVDFLEIYPSQCGINES